LGSFSKRSLERCKHGLDTNMVGRQKPHLTKNTGSKFIVGFLDTWRLRLSQNECRIGGDLMPFSQ
jgi:hypothetical protein